jgi:hypothetical protein
MFHLKTCLTALVFAGIFAVAPPAAASDTAAVAQNDEAATRLRDIIADEAARQHRQRQAAAGLAFGLAGLSAGFGVGCFAIKPTNGESLALTLGGVGFEVVAGLAIVLGAVVLVDPTPIEKLSREYELVLRDPSQADHLAWAEHRLRDLAERERRARMTAAVLAISVAPFVSGGGIALAALLPSGTNDVMRAAYVAVFQLLAVMDVTVGVIRLVSVDPVERIWRTWMLGTGRGVQARSYFAPVVGGATGGFTLSF